MWLGSVGWEGGVGEGKGGEGKVEGARVGIGLGLGWVGEGPDVEGIEKAVLYQEGGWKGLG